jgi:hypothetical protein
MHGLAASILCVALLRSVSGFTAITAQQLTFCLRLYKIFHKSVSCSLLQLQTKMLSYITGQQLFVYDSHRNEE